jgi:DNA-binding NarL/FixJ family response regulator
MRQRLVFIVDDHPIVRQGLRRMIDLEPDLAVCGEAESERQARTALRSLEPDVVIIDLSLTEGDGIELVRDLHAQRPQLPLLVLSMHDELIYAQRLLAAGASGYIMKHAASDQLLGALRLVLEGGIYLSDAIADATGTRPKKADKRTASNPVDQLSNRELQVLSLIGRGLSSREAAATLGVSVKTVESHRQSLKRKLHLATNALLLHYAINWMRQPSA